MHTHAAQRQQNKRYSIARRTAPSCLSCTVAELPLAHACCHLFLYYPLLLLLRQRVAEQPPAPPGELWPTRQRNNPPKTVCRDSRPMGCPARAPIGAGGFLFRRAVL